MIGYVILIVIAISLGIAVYAFLKLYLPKDVAECYDDVSISLENVTCKNQEVKITFRNRGLFSIHGVFVRIGEPDRVFRELLRQEIFPLNGGVLKPGDEYKSTYPYIYTTPPAPPLIREVEIQPYVFVKNEAAICERAVVKKVVSCV